MTLLLRVKKQDASKTKKFLIDNNLLNNDFRVKKEEEHILFPINEEFELNELSFEASFTEGEAEKSKLLEIPKLEDELKKILSVKEMEVVSKSQDVIGDIAIIEIPDALISKEKEIAKIFLKCNPSIVTVLKKGKHEGVFRLQKLDYLVGEDKKETIHVENKARLFLNVEDVYFSPRMANERLRISKLVKKGEEVLVMFSGAGPYPLVIAKNSEAKKIDGVEINPKGKEFGDVSIKKNKINNVFLYTGDVYEVIPKLVSEGKKYDRVVMPAPHNANSFLKTALGALKKKGFIHFYDFVHEDEFEKRVDELILEAKSNGRKAKLLGIYKVGQNKPRMYRTCIDLEILE